MPTLSPSTLPFLGAGLGYRRAIRPFFAQHRDLLGFLEVMPEHLLYTDRAGRAALAEDAAGFAVVTHGVSTSIGSAMGPDLDYVRRCLPIHSRMRAPWTSDHLSFTKVGRRNIGQLTPIPYTDESLAVVVANVKAVQRILRRPFLLENISQYFQFAKSDLTEGDFLSEVCRRTGCGALLDVTNLRNNAANLGTDPERYLDEFPLERLVQFHLAGSEWVGGHLLDTHGAAIHADVWRMTRRAIDNSHVRALLIERDQTFGRLPRLAAEVRRAHKLMQGASGA